MKRDGTAVAAAATYTLIFWADIPRSIMLIQAGAITKATALILILDSTLSLFKKKTWQYLFYYVRMLEFFPVLKMIRISY